jgi:bifunctional non-homologous end joining protein LigD
MSTQSVTIGEHTIKVTNLDRVMYPDGSVTKAEVLHYLVSVADVLGRHLRDRILTRKRWPHGVTEESFFEKNLPRSAPEWIATLEWGRDPVRYPVLSDQDLPASLAWFAQIGVLEFHVPQWRVPESGPPRVDRIVIDLDPGPPAGLEECRKVALAVRESLMGLNLEPVPVLSGSKGLQLYVPVREGGPLPVTMDADGASEFAHTLALSLETAMPNLVVSRMTKAIRPGRVLLDWSQNNGAKTTIAPYSPRGTRAAQVATPLSWAEVESGDLRQHTLAEVLARLDEFGDLAAGI